MTKAKSDKTTVVVNLKISPPKMALTPFVIRGTAPLMINRFSKKAELTMRATQEAGSQSRSKKVREAKDFQAIFEGASYRSKDGWYGINASAFRLAMIGACKLVGFHMTLAKLAVSVVADGEDREDGTPLIRIVGEDPQMDVRPARNSNGSTDLRVRPMWREWGCTVNVRFDSEVFSLTDVTNLMMRVGEQCGIGEGRPSSKMSAGLGLGTFKVVIS